LISFYGTDFLLTTVVEPIALFRTVVEIAAGLAACRPFGFRPGLPPFAFFDWFLDGVDVVRADRLPELLADDFRQPF